MPRIGDDTFCIKTSCPNQTTHKSGYCEQCRTFVCPACLVTHTVTKPPHDKSLRYCAQCRRKKR